MNSVSKSVYYPENIFLMLPNVCLNNLTGVAALVELVAANKSQLHNNFDSVDKLLPY